MLKKGKEEIIYLLNKSIDKYQMDTGKEIIQNTNRKNYEGLAVVLSEISNNLPNTEAEFGHDSYSKDRNIVNSSYPFRKYDITGGQIKDASMGLVSNPRNFMVDACYIYLYQKGRKAFEQSPCDNNLVFDGLIENKQVNYSLVKENMELKMRIQALETHTTQKLATFISRKMKWALFLLVAFLTTTIITITYQYYNDQKKWEIVKSDLMVLPYVPSTKEIQDLEGFWICYTGSPQARPSDPNRFHKVVLNFIEIKYKDGYFIYNRYGANFNHIGFAKFLSPNLVTIFSTVKNGTSLIESPRYTLLELSNSQYLNVISASWNFDTSSNNKMIGIREVYSKIGKGGSVSEVINTKENASCQCKIIHWLNKSGEKQTWFLKNSILDSLAEKKLIPLLNQNSILLKNPDEGIILSQSAKE